MAAKGNTLKKNKPKEEPEDLPGKPKKKSKRTIPLWITDGRLSKIFGVFLVLVSIYLLFAFTSYLFQYFSWDADDIFSQFSFKEIFTDNSEVAQNWAGRLGAALSILFIKKGFGVASYFFILILFVAGLKYSLKIALLPLWKTIINSLAGIVWFSVALGFILRNTSYAILGGITGYQSAFFLEGLLGKTGTAILLFFTLLAILVFAFNMPLSLPKPPVDSASESEDDLAYSSDNGTLLSDKKLNVKNTTITIPEDKYNTVEYAVKEEEEDTDDFIFLSGRAE